MGRPSVITGKLGKLVEDAGGVEELANRLDTTRTTIYRWGSGESTPEALARRAVNEYARRRGLPAPFDEGPRKKGARR